MSLSLPLASVQLELVLLGVLLALGALLLAAYHWDAPYPILLVLGGAGLGFIPGVPPVTVRPELVLVIFLPPLLYSAAFFSSLRDLRDNVGSISLLAIGLVVATTAGVAVAAHAIIDGLSWEAAFVLGAVVSPTDPVAASAIASRVGAPGRFVTIVEGESLVNDATALVAYKFALSAAVTGSFSLAEASGRFVLNAVAGVAIGLAVGAVVAELRRRLDDAPTEISVSLITPYLAYLPAEAAGVSAVLAAVTAGIYLGWRSPQLITPSTRIQAFSVWEILVFLLNAALFLLVGLQLPEVIDGITGMSVVALVRDAAVVVGVVIVLRFVWVFGTSSLAPLAGRRCSRLRPAKSPNATLLVAWTGMRGAVSLAAALAIPDSVPARDLIVFITYAVIFVTLVLQGLSLPAVIRGLGVEDDGTAEQRESKARLRAAHAAIQRIDELTGEEWVRDETADRMKRLYDFRIRRFSARFDDDDDGDIEAGSLAYQRLRREVLEAERAEIIRMRNQGHINDDIMRRIERDLDLEDTRLEL